MIGTDHQPICVPGNATIMVPGKIKDKQQRVIYVWRLLLMPIYHQV